MRTTRSEARYTTQDGRIWPVTRDRMENPRHIGDRMVQDIAALINEGEMTPSTCAGSQPVLK